MLHRVHKRLDRCIAAYKVLLRLRAVREDPPKMGLKNSEMTKKPQMVRPVTPVRPPSRMPEADSIYAVAEEEPNTPVRKPNTGDQGLDK